MKLESLHSARWAVEALEKVDQRVAGKQAGTRLRQKLIEAQWAMRRLIRSIGGGELV